MIVTCTGCHARYRLDATKVPARKIRVRCPDCTTIFDLDGAARAAEPGQEPLVTETFNEAGPPLAPAVQSGGGEDLVIETASAAAHVDSEIAAGPAPAPASRPATSSEAPRPARRRRRDKSEMLARALVSDILVYNREARDQALADGNLLEALGPEIKKSWELYKEKVGAAEASGTTHFKDALNEILAEGQAIF